MPVARNRDRTKVPRRDENERLLCKWHTVRQDIERVGQSAFFRIIDETFDWLEAQGATFNDLLDKYVETKKPVYFQAMLAFQVDGLAKNSRNAKPRGSTEELEALLTLSDLKAARRRTRSKEQALELVAASSGLEVSEDAEDIIKAGRQKLLRWEKHYAAEFAHFQRDESLRGQILARIAIVQIRVACLAVRLHAALGLIDWGVAPSTIGGRNQTRPSDCGAPKCRSAPI